MRALYVVAFALAMLFAYIGARKGVIGFDFEGTLWDAAVAIREGRSPYPAPVVIPAQESDGDLWRIALAIVLVGPVSTLSLDVSNPSAARGQR